MHPHTPRRVTAAVLLFAGTLGAQTPSATELARTVDAHYNHLKSLQARYTERYQGMGMDRTESGTLLLRKPGRMRWAYDTPAGKLFVLNGKDAVSYTPGDPQASRLPTKQLDDLRSPLRFLLGHTELARELDHLTVAPVEGGFSLAGAPRGMGQRLQAIILLVDAAGVIHELRIEETDGARTTFTFTGIREDVPAPDSAFVFVPPPGVEVVNGTSPL